MEHLTVKDGCLAFIARLRTDVENGCITSTQDILTELTNCMVQIKHLKEPAAPSSPVVQPEEISDIKSTLTVLQGQMASLQGTLSRNSEKTERILVAVENGATNAATAPTAHSGAADSAPAGPPPATSAPANSAPANSAPANSAPASSATANSHPTVRGKPAAPKPGIVHFPGGPRTITIHPPGSTEYQSMIHDDQGALIIDFRRSQPLRREGAFRGLPVDEDDYARMRSVFGRGPRPADAPVPPVPNWPDCSPPSPSPRPCGASDVIARQRQLAESMDTDEHGRLIPAEYAIRLEVPAVPAGSSSSPSSSQDSQESSSSSVKGEGVSTPSSTTPPFSPPSGRGKKRTRASKDADSAEASGTQSTPVVDGKKPASTVNKTPETATSVQREESESSESPAKRRKLRPSTTLKRTPSTRPLTRSFTMADVRDN